LLGGGSEKQLMFNESSTAFKLCLRAVHLSNDEASEWYSHFWTYQFNDEIAVSIPLSEGQWIIEAQVCAILKSKKTIVDPHIFGIRRKDLQI
jgi:hypothetical protein